MQKFGFIKRETCAVLMWQRGHVVAPTRLTGTHVGTYVARRLRASGLSGLGPQA